ncbi:MAG TPA: FAD-dependent oxidoreductase [Candidatus Paceibacterota bacterium]|jgi:NADH dehydrogenase|nr:FAD-dependent oxidoreductase [Candidatus Paceibacterota bacterium]
MPIPVALAPSVAPAPPVPKKNIVVLGAGFGGLRAAMDIAKGLRAANLLAKYDVVLVDKNDCQLYTPLLYEAAAGPSNSPHGKIENVCTYDISSLIKGLPIRFVQNEIAALDLPNGDVHLKTGEELRADFLVIALGSETNFFGISGLKENALQMKSIEQAMAVREAISNAFGKGGEVKIVVGGGGANGCELAGEIRLWANRAGASKVSVGLLEAMPTLLPGLDARVTKIAAARLAKLGVEVMTAGKIVSVAPKEISLDGGKKIPFDVFVWTGGIRTPDMVTQLPLTKEPHGKPLAKSDMICLPATPDLKLYPMVYAIGDSVCFMNPKTNRPVPAVARAAIDEGAVAAHNVVEEIKKIERAAYAPALKNYTPVEYPYVIPIGEGWAVAKFGPFVFSGWPAIVFKKFIELDYLWSVMSLWTALRVWMQ